MLVWLAEYLTQYATFFNVFSYLTMRAILSVLTALLISLWMGPALIRALQRLQVGQAVRDDGPQSHLSKTGTPTMGGVLIIASIVVSTLLWADLSNRYVQVVLGVVLGFGLVGFVDDYRKVVQKNSRGLPAKWKYFWQSLIATVAAVVLYAHATLGAETQLLVPFFKDVMPQLGLLYVLLAYFVIVGTSNAVNLTDGLDGLAIVPTIMVAGALGIFAYASGNANFAAYLNIPFLPLSGELLIVCTAIFGAGLGFLWFNTYPAMVFMGDVGSLALGAALGLSLIHI